MDETYLYIGNLPFDASEGMVRNMLAKVATVQNVWLAWTPDEPKKFRGFGFAQLSSKADVEKAFKELNGTELGDTIPRAVYLEPGLSELDLWQETNAA